VKKVIRSGGGDMLPAGFPIGYVEPIDTDAAAQMGHVIIRFARQSRTANRVPMGQKLFGQPGTGKAADAGDIGFNDWTP